VKSALVLALVGLPLAAQQGARGRIEGRVPAPAVAPVDSIIRVAAAAGLPTEPLVQKALEGGAKKVDAARIVAAVADQAGELAAARALLRRTAPEQPISPAELIAVTNALVRGLAPERVEQIATALPGEPTGPAVHAVADMVGHGFDEDSSVALIVAAARSGVRGLRLLDVATAAVQEVQRGLTRDSALAKVNGELPNVPLPPQPPRATVARARRPAHALPPVVARGRDDRSQ